MNATNPPPGWVLYDADCAFCVRCAAHFESLLRRGGLRLAPLQTPWARERLPAAMLLDEMRLIEADGRVYGGADALLQIARHYRWARPAAALAGHPPFKPLLDRGYRWFAARRHCSGKVCAQRNKRRHRTIVFLEMP